ncbi:unnamed protein product [Cercopithifilaria johnstoni]|uniref:Uncharacterized protein n=1 Tax=Cercopithifilaria johnstoni TaxID=2874296 RepID=A0A8J2M274_9BILA|nr:unnamed protein product [Cercopithifilaria johnstoni]
MYENNRLLQLLLLRKKDYWRFRESVQHITEAVLVLTKSNPDIRNEKYRAVQIGSGFGFCNGGSQNQSLFISIKQLDDTTSYQQQYVYHVTRDIHTLRCRTAKVVLSYEGNVTDETHEVHIAANAESSPVLF